eukprot:1741485-Pleurochrysis_carterae.AAC.1
MTRKRVRKAAMGRRAAGLVSEAFRVAINQRRYSPDLASLTAVQVEQQLLLRRELVSFGASIFEATISSLSAAAGALKVVPDNAGSSASSQ